MSTHINAANKNDIAESILLPGDPLRAKFIAENFLDSPKCYNEIRGMLGYTGTYRGVPVSVQGTGMGRPSRETMLRVPASNCSPSWRQHQSSWTSRSKPETSYPVMYSMN